MKKLFQIIGFTCLMCFSFFYTEKTVSVVKEHDEIMIQIKKYQENYYKEPINAIINNNTIIPGISGLEINLDKSYSKMKRLGKFDQTLIVTKKLEPNISIKNTYNKFVINGSKGINQLSFLFILENNKYQEEILKILKEKDIKATFFIDDTYYETNEISEITKQEHNLGNSIQNFLEPSFAWLNNEIKKKQNKTYCLDLNYNEDLLNICSASKIYTIHPGLIIKNNITMEIKKNIHSGLIVLIYPNQNIVEELRTTINYVKSKGYKLEKIETLLTE